MAEFSKLVITDKGQALLSKMIAGTGSVQFTKISTSSNIYAAGQLVTLSSLMRVEQTSDVTKITRINSDTVKVETAFSNAGLKTGYYMRTLGLYALDPDEGEILYAVASETSGNCYMPADNGSAVSGAYIELVTTVGNAENVTLNVDQAAVATVGDIKDLQEQISDLQAMIGYTDDDIFGVEVDFVNKKFKRLAGAVGRTPGAGFDDVNCFGGRRRCYLAPQGLNVEIHYYGDPIYTSAENGNGTIMVEQPKFYYKVVPLVTEIINEGQNNGYHLRKARYYVSPQPKAGFKIHPAFVGKNGTVNDRIYLAAYEGSVYDKSEKKVITDDNVTLDTENDYLVSVVNAKPASGAVSELTLTNAGKLAVNHGNANGTNTSGWGLSTAATISASQLLMLIEYASFDMQTKIGMGPTLKTEEGTGNLAENTGATSSLGNKSGTVENENGVQFVSYRGEENLWGNIWTWVNSSMNVFNGTNWDGENKNGKFNNAHGTLYIDGSAHTDTGIYPVYSTGKYPSAFGYSKDYDWLFIPTEVLGTSVAPVGDCYWNASPTSRYVCVGGKWNDNTKAGPFAWYMACTNDEHQRYIGARLVFIPRA